MFMSARDDRSPKSLAVQQTVPRSAPAREKPPSQSAPAPKADFASLKWHFLTITSQIEALQDCDQLELSTAACRKGLAEIHHAIAEAMPRSAVESIESEIRLLRRRIEEVRANKNDGDALVDVERALSEIREVLGSLTPAEQITGYSEEISDLGTKLDQILRSNNNPAAAQKLEDKISALRALVSNVASNKTLAQLSEGVQLLSSEVDKIDRASNRRDHSAILERDIEALIAALQTESTVTEWPVAEQPADESTKYLESAICALSEQVEALADPHSDHLDPAENHLHDILRDLGAEQPVDESTNRTQSEPLASIAEPGSGHLDPVERHLHSILRDLEAEQPVDESTNRTQSEQLESIAEPHSGHLDPAGSDLHDIVRDLEAEQPVDESANRTRSEQLESIAEPHSGDLDPVERHLHSILRDLEAKQPVDESTNRTRSEPLESIAEPRSGHLDPAGSDLHDILRDLEAELSNFSESSPAPNPSGSATVESADQETSDSRLSRAEADHDIQDPIVATYQAASVRADEMALEDDLRAVHAASSAPEQMAAPYRPTEPAPATRAQSGLKKGLPNPFVDTSDEFQTMTFAPPTPGELREMTTPRASADVAAARELMPLEPRTRSSGRAATPAERLAMLESAIGEILPAPKEPVASSNVVAPARRTAETVATPPEKRTRSAQEIRLAELREGMRLSSKQAEKESSETISRKARAFLVGAGVVIGVVILGLGAFLAIHVLLGSGGSVSQATQNSSTNNSAQMPSNHAEPVETPPVQVEPPQSQPAANDDISRTISTAPVKVGLGVVQVPPGERLPDGIGGPILRSAAMKGDPAAAYEVGLRFAEGKGVAVNYGEAAKWLDRAVQAGVVPAAFEVGKLYEKGLGVAKDLDIARRYYTQAAERGNAGAMHNLAVIEADSGNHKSAAGWFRKAADHGVVDSQFNLAILYARGLGVEENLVQSYKWFSLAAAQGDRDAAERRDDIATRMDPKSLAEAKLAIQNFAIEPMPDDAVSVTTAPAGGWDKAQASTAKRASEQVAGKPAIAR